MEETKPSEVGIEKHYSPAEIAEAMGLCTETVTRLLEKEEGIVRIGRRGRERTRVTIRIPQSSWERIHKKWMLAGIDSPGGRSPNRRTKTREVQRNGQK